MSFYLAIGVFALAYVLIITEKIPRTISALAGGGVMVYLGLITQDTALREHIDFNTIGLLAGMMLLIAIVKRSGFFEAMALWSVKKSGGEARRLLVLLAVITGLGAAFIDSVTAALLIAPITISICHMLRLSPIPILISEVLVSNIGGTALMIGNPPNVMIGSATHLDFNDMFFNLAPIVLIVAALTVAVLLFVYRRQLVSERLTPEQLAAINVASAIKDSRLLKRSLAVLLLTIAGFIGHSALGLQSATIAMTGGVLAMLVCRVEPESVFREVDFDTLFFFMGLFVMVGALEVSGVIEKLAKFCIEMVGTDVKVMTFAILFMSGLSSAFIDNIPFTATMIPLIKDMQALLQATGADHMWWALALGACFGGNGTIIGASPNVIIIAIAAKDGWDISFGKFFATCFPLMLMSLALSAMYIYARYFC